MHAIGKLAGIVFKASLPITSGIFSCRHGGMAEYVLLSQGTCGELVNAMQPAQGTHLWFPIGPLLRSPRSIAQRAVQERLPEVVVEGAKEVKILG